MNRLEHYKLLTPHQVGFRRRLGTSDALQALHDAWITAVGRGGTARILAVDIAGALDRVSHAGLLHKVRHLGIGGPLHTWFSSYLGGRSIKCLVGGKTSSLYTISAGVPQGSILGPTIFLHSAAQRRYSTLVQLFLPLATAATTCHSNRITSWLDALSTIILPSSHRVFGAAGNTSKCLYPMSGEGGCKSGYQP